MENAKTAPEFTPLDQELFDARIIQISGPINSPLAKEVNKLLLTMDRKSKKPIYLFINSPGGEITSGFSIFDTAQMIESEIITMVCGLAASMGSLIALCANKENRIAAPNSKFLIHQPLISGTMQGSASELEIHARDIIKTKEKINQIYANETGKPIQEIKEATDRDYWMTAQEAKDFGLIHRIVKSTGEIFK
jgi:ATP-dependent Clp protease protease subunit